MDHPLIAPPSRCRSFGIALLLGLFGTPALAQTLSGLTARQSGTSVVLELATVSSVNIEDLDFFYSENGGSRWQPIDKDCLTPVSSRSVEWAVLECLGVDAFAGDNIRFKASAIPCSGTIRFDGYDYRLVAIGSQCWFAENLRSDNYANGDAIPSALSQSAWQSTTSGAVAVYESDVSNLATYGRLYNWYAVNDPRGLCPSGWHVPTDEEWTALTDHLGGKAVAGEQIKSSPSDSPRWNGTNSSGFSGLPGGNRPTYGNFNSARNRGYWWSSSPYSSTAWGRELSSNGDNVGRYGSHRRNGFSVRCVRD